MPGVAYVDHGPVTTIAKDVCRVSVNAIAPGVSSKNAAGQATAATWSMQKIEPKEWLAGGREPAAFQRNRPDAGLHFNGWVEGGTTDESFCYRL